MVTLTFIFWMFVVLFAMVGALRGWAKELLVSFAVLLALFLLTVMERFIPFIEETLAEQAGVWVQVAILIGMVFFGYQTPNLARLAGSNRFVRERIQDSLLGLFLGALNGYLVFGSIWFFLHQANYPFPNIIAPVAGTPVGDAALKLIAILPPHWMGAPTIYFAVAIAFVFVLVVFI